MFETLILLMITDFHISPCLLLANNPTEFVNRLFVRMRGELVRFFRKNDDVMNIQKVQQVFFTRKLLSLQKKKSYREQHSHSHYDYVNKMMSVKWGRKRNNKA